MPDHTPTSSLVPLRDHQPARLIKGEILRGCNQYHHSTVIRQEIDFGNIRGISTRDAGASFATQFTQRFIQADRTQPGSIINERFLAALRSSAGVGLEEALLEATLYVESSMAFVMHRFEPITYACHVGAKSPGNSLLVWETKVPKISLRAMYVALIGLTDLLPAELRASYLGASAEFTSSYAALEDDATQRQISTTTSVILLAAKARKIACEHLGGPHVRLGQGAAQRMLYASVLSDTSHAATQLSRDKAKTLRTLAQLGLPVPAQIRVASVDSAIEAAEKLGYPVVVKPLKGKQAGGVTVGIESPHELALAFARAHTSGSDVLVESFVPGATYRLLVIGGRCVAALCIVPPSVLGDSEHSIEELIVALNNDPLRNSVRLFKVAIDDDLTATLNRQGYGLDSVPSNGTPIMLRSAANVAVGGIHTDVTDLVHPANRAMAERAAQAIGLAVAGIDFLTRDISLPFDDVGGNIIEVNARPGLCMHTFPRHGEGRSVADDLLQLVFPGANAGRIRIAMLVGDRGVDAVAKSLASLFRVDNAVTGLVTKKAVFVNDERQALDSRHRLGAMRRLLRDPRIDLLIGTRSARSVVNRGLGLDALDAAMISTSAAEDGLPAYQTCIAVLMMATRGAIICGAQNEVALSMLTQCAPDRIILVSLQPDDPRVESHVHAGGRAVVTDEERGRKFIIARNRNGIAMRVDAPNAGGNLDAPKVETLAFAVALALGLGASSQRIVNSVQSAYPENLVSHLDKA